MKYLFIFLSLFCGISLNAQVNNPCEGDIVGKRAGSGTYKIPADCDIIIMSLETYDSLGLLRKKQEVEIKLLDEEVLLLKKGQALRDSVITEKDGIIKAQDAALAEYKAVAEKAIQEGVACTANTDRCLGELEKQRMRTKIFTLLGAAGGFVVGLITGIVAF